MYKVERNVPIPEAVLNRKRGSNYPFCEMKVGDSFLIPASCILDKVGFTQKVKSKISVSSTKYRRLHNSKARFLCSFDRACDGVRVWRIV